jgi:hypothetical protein
MRLATLAVVALACAGCSPKGVVQLALSHDDSLGDPSEQVKRLEVVVSSPQGLAGVTSEGKRPGGGEARDWDGDGKLEIVFAQPSSAIGKALEIGLGADEDRLLEFRVAGYADDQSTRPIAYGDTALTPVPGAINKLGVSFNLRPEARPPQVVLVLPPDLTSGVPGNLAAVTLAFSTTVDPSHLDGATVTGPGGVVAVETRLETITLRKGDPLEEQRSVLNLRLPGLADGTYQVRVGAPLVSLAGRAFDQNPRTADADAFTSTFEVKWGVGVPPECNCAAPYVCQDEPGGLWSCAFGSTCAAGCATTNTGTYYVCDPATQQCVEDCSRLQLCPLTCVSATGLCH